MNDSDLRARLRGISGVPVTAYDAAGEVDAGRTAQVYARVAEAGIHNIVVAGNTGEFYALTPDELRRVQTAAAEGIAGRAAMTVAVGRSLREAITMAREAKAAGAQAVMAHQPVDPFAAPAARIAYFRQLADAAELPVVAYLRADSYSVDELLELGAHPNVVAVKFAAKDLQLLARTIAAAEGQGALWVCGLAEAWAPAFAAVGATGFTSGLVSVAPQFSLQMLAALERGDFAAARRIMALIEPFERMRAQFHDGANVTVVKEAVTLLGLDVGPVRAPGLARLSDEDRARLADLLDSWGIERAA